MDGICSPSIWWVVYSTLPNTHEMSARCHCKLQHIGYISGRSYNVNPGLIHPNGWDNLRGYHFISQANYGLGVPHHDLYHSSTRVWAHPINQGNQAHPGLTFSQLLDTPTARGCSELVRIVKQRQRRDKRAGKKRFLVARAKSLEGFIRTADLFRLYR